MRIVVWWCIPCKGIYPLFSAFAQNNGECRFIVEQENMEMRKRLGWESPHQSNLTIESLEHTGWEKTVKQIIQDEKNSIHIFNSIRIFPKIFFALQHAVRNNLKYGIYSEAPFNPYRGIKSILKDLYTYNITKYRNKKYFNKSDFILCASGDAREKLVKLGWPENKIYPFGYFTEYIDLKLNQNSDSQKIKLLCTGYITKYKGHLVLLKAINRLKEQNKKFECHITGFGPEQKKLDKYAKKHGLKHVQFHGVVDNEKLDLLMKESDILVAPGYEEPWGIRINEAINYNLAVIVSDGIGASQLIDNFKCGIIFKSGSHKSLAEALKSYLINPKQLSSHKMNSEQAKEKISPKYVAKKLAKTLESIYNRKNNNNSVPWE